MEWLKTNWKKVAYAAIVLFAFWFGFGSGVSCEKGCGAGKAIESK